MISGLACCDHGVLTISWKILAALHRGADLFHRAFEAKDTICALRTVQRISIIRVRMIEVSSLTTLLSLMNEADLKSSRSRLSPSKSHSHSVSKVRAKDTDR